MAWEGLVRDQVLRVKQNVGRGPVVRLKSVRLKGYAEKFLGTEDELRDSPSPLEDCLVIISNYRERAAVDPNKFLNQEQVKRVDILKFVHDNVVIAIWLREIAIRVLFLQFEQSPVLLVVECDDSTLPKVLAHFLPEPDEPGFCPSFR